MSGFGERFRRAGYTIPKPLIEIEGKPIIAHVIDMFPGEVDFIFICNYDHLSEPSFRMEETILKYCPTARIIPIAPHKLGPVHAVLQVLDQIDFKKPVIVNYADFTCYWNWNQFKDFVNKNHCDGAIPAYKGFHPHSLGNTNYAYMREKDGWVLDIQEKKPYTKNRMDEYASSGTYYFATGELMFGAFQSVVNQDLNVNGEYYVSLAYKPLLAQGKSIAVYDLKHFMQWGTPEDLDEYRGWSDTFRNLINPTYSLHQHSSGAVIIPMAGLGKRFSDEGYTITKPLIPVSGKPMVIQAASDILNASHFVFVLRTDMPGFDEIKALLENSFPSAILVPIAAVTEGQACTAKIGLDALSSAVALKDKFGPITFGTCDNGVLYNFQSFNRLLNDPEIDIIVWGVRGHAGAIRNPAMYGWIDVKGNDIHRVSVKTPLGDPSNDPIIIGTFTFKHASDFQRCVSIMIERNGRINGEFYIDTCINDAIELGLKCRLFEVDSYMSWGTPNELRTYEYWQSCFHKWAGHPYRLEKDNRIPTDCLCTLNNKYSDEF